MTKKSVLPFKKEHPLAKRCQLSKKIRDEYSDKVPVIVESHVGKTAVNLEKTRYIVSNFMTVGALLTEVRKNVALKPEEALFMFSELSDGSSVIAPIGQTIGFLDSKYKCDDGFLYFVICKESTFGC